jgi:hypothetical protein
MSSTASPHRWVHCSQGSWKRNSKPRCDWGLFGDVRLTETARKAAAIHIFVGIRNAVETCAPPLCAAAGHADQMAFEEVWLDYSL